jgi:hypothetical protein
MYCHRFCACAISIHLDTSVQVTNIGMNPPYVDLYYATTVFFSSCDCARAFSQTGNGDFEGPSSTSKVLWLQNESPYILCFFSWCPLMWWLLCSACFWCQNHMWKTEAEVSRWKYWPNGLPFTICNFSTYLANHLKRHVILLLCIVISGLVIVKCS